MTSADFLAYRKRIYSKTSPGKMNTLWMNPAASTVKAFVLRHFRTSVCCATSSNFYSLLCSFCSSVPSFAGSLTSVLASQQTTLRLATLPRFFQGVERLALSGFLPLLERTIFIIQGAHSTYPKGGVSCSADSFEVAKSSVLRMKFSGKIPALRVAAKRWQQW